MTPGKGFTRRKFVGTTAAAGAFTIVAPHVLGGTKYTAPSDKINVANIGCGTQGMREMADMLENDAIRVSSVCDPNKFSTDYLDWSLNGIRDNIRRTLKNPKWGANLNGIPGGRDIAKQYIDEFYNDKSCTSYEDFRELLEKEDIDAVKIMTPDHLHAPIALAAMDKGRHVITHKPIANRMMEGRKVIEKARQTGLVTHLLAWDDKPDNIQIKRWIQEGEIGTLKEIHNWSFRPVWQQWTSNPTDTPPVPEGFNWDLWLGPVPDRPYHPNYTWMTFRGWYDFGGGSIADMGHYSWFPLFQALDIKTPPTSAKAYGTTNRTIVNQVSASVDNDVAFPYSCMVKLKFPKQEWLPEFDLIWYDGGMKPFAPEELEADGEDTPNEGLLFVGDKGKILAGFEGEGARLIPKSRMDAYKGDRSLPKKDERSRSHDWATGVRDNKQTLGSFIEAECVTEAILLGGVALRSGKRVDWDSKNMRITNDKDANKYLTREYRKGWEI